MGGAFMVGVSAENRASAGVVGGDEVDVDIELDTAPREVTVPTDFAKRSSGMRPPSGPSTGCPTARSSGTCCRSREPREKRPGSDGSTSRSARCERAALAELFAGRNGTRREPSEGLLMDTNIADASGLRAWT